MKKLIKLLGASLLSVGLLVGCGTGNNENNDQAGSGNQNEGNKNEDSLQTLVVGASNVPHAEILEFAKPLLEDKGIDLEIITFNDYVLPNEALDSKELDANYFQHVPYLELQIETHGYDFVNAGGIHIEPIGIYSQEYKSLDELPDGAEFIISDSVADHGRILMMLEDHGLIKLAEGVGIGATLDDIVENPRNFKFLANIEPALLSSAYEHGEGDAVLINSNYALDAGLNPLKDSIAIESADQDNPYVNVVAVRSGDEKDERIQALLEVLYSEDVKNFILEKYEGAVVPVEN